MGLGKVSTTQILTSAIIVAAGSAFEPWTEKRTFHANGTTSAGAGAATIKIQVSNEGSTWIEIGTITLVLATTVSGDGFASDAPWRYVRANVTAISGTDGTVNVYMSCIGS